MKRKEKPKPLEDLGLLALKDEIKRLMKENNQSELLRAVTVLLLRVTA